MTRRGWLTRLIGVITGWFAAPVNAKDLDFRKVDPKGSDFPIAWYSDEPSYEYDWKVGETDDPAFHNKHLHYGGEDVHEVFVDGKLVKFPLHPFALKTGREGWVKCYKKEGVTFEEEPEGHLKEYVLRGRVVYLYYKQPQSAVGPDE